MAKRRSRTEQAELTRQSLLDAARTVFIERGFHAASLDAIADEAGFTKGAVYSQFHSKADLFLALLEQRIVQRIAEMRRSAETVRGPAELATALSRQWDEKLRGDEQWSLLSIEFRLHAARDPDLNRRYAALHAQTRDAIAALIEREAAETGVVLSIPAEDIARGVLALGTGAVLERCAEGSSFPPRLMEMTNRAMIFGLEMSEREVPARAKKRAVP